MGFVSNQWLNRGWGLRNRGYFPVPVTVECAEADSEWEQANEVVIVFTARKGNGEYQTLLLTQPEADDVAATIASGMSAEGREALVPSLLRDLSDAKLLEVLSADLRKRTAT